MIVDVYNEVFSKLKNEMVGTCVSSSYPENATEFPCVIVSEISNVLDKNTKDSSGGKYSEVSFEVQIFTIGEDKKSQARTIRSEVDAVFSDFFGMDRDFADEVENYADLNIYRYIMRYTMLIDANKIIHNRR